MKRYLLMVLIGFVSSVGYAQIDSILISTSVVQGKVNKEILGINIPNYVDQSLVGTQFVDLMKDMQPKRLRWPGGNNACNYNWKIDGSWRDTLSNQLGVNIREIVRLCDSIGAELQITVNFGTMNAKDAADLVRYVRDSLHTTVKYWEIGNELSSPHMWEYSWSAENPHKYYFGGYEQRRGTFFWGQEFKGDFFASNGEPNQEWLIHFPDVLPGSDTVRIKDISTSDFRIWTRVDSLKPGDTTNYELDYTQGILKFGDGVSGWIPPDGCKILCEYTTINHDGYITFVDSMKAVDPTIKIGSCFFPPDTMWSTDTLDMIFSRIDFIVRHQYRREDEFRPESYYTRMTYAPTSIAGLFSLRAAINYWASIYKDSIGIGLTEWNFIFPGTIKEDASLASALFAAEKIGWLIHFSDSLNLKIANHWETIQPWTFYYFALLKYPEYTRRPVYYVFKMFTHYFGDTLVNTTTFCDSFNVEGHNFPYLVAFGSERNDTLFIIVVNKDSTQAHTVQMKLFDFNPDSQGIVHVLNADGIYATNEDDSMAVIIRDSVITNVSNNFTYTFPAHSVTAIEISLGCIKGDVNDDGAINILDVVLTVNIILGIHDPTPREFCAADFNSDGEVNVLDVVQMVNEILGTGT